MKLNKKVDFLKLGEKMLGIVMMLMAITLPLSPALADLPTPPCGALAGVRCDVTGGPNDLIVRIINILLGVAFLIAVLFLVYGGFQYIFSAGNEERAEGGRNTVINALIGVAIIVLSYVIVQIVSRTVSTGGSGAPF